jgi:hypothetical protein
MLEVSMNLDNNLSMSSLTGSLDTHNILECARSRGHRGPRHGSWLDVV